MNNDLSNNEINDHKNENKTSIKSNTATLTKVNESEEKPVDFTKNSTSSSEHDQSNKYFKHTYAWLSLISKIIIIAGGIFAIIEFQASKKDTRIKNTFEYITAYERGPVLESREGIRRKFRSHVEGFKNNLLTPFDHKRLILTLSEESTGTDRIMKDDLDRIIDFHEGLNRCLELGLCDDDVTKNYFHPKAEKFWEDFEPYITSRRCDENKNFGKDLEWFATYEYNFEKKRDCKTSGS